jgi:hypothetical protein
VERGLVEAERMSIHHISDNVSSRTFFLVHSNVNRFESKLMKMFTYAKRSAI